ncbi:MAG: acyl--CoA ligase [Mycobacteriaceae bacterium]|nr:acyl--CoA ligase [Mycobacteriaceae bacterium]
MPGSALTVPQALRERVRCRGDHRLLVCDAERISYAVADRRSAQLARGLIGLGAGPGTHVGVLYPNGVAFVVAMLAAARIGAVVVPFSTLATPREVREQLAHSDTEILLSAASYRSHDYLQRLAEAVPGPDFDSTEPIFSCDVPQLRHIAIGFERIDRLAASVDQKLLEAMEDDVDGADPLTIVYTSGSTGAPKGVVHTHAALLTHQHNLNEIRGLTAEDILFCNSPFFWIGGLGFGLLATIVAGATLVCSNSTDPSRTLDLLEAERPTVTNGFVAGIAHLAHHPSFGERDLSSMRRGNLYPIMAAEVRPADPQLRHNMLGLTEAGGVALLSDDESDQPEHRRGSFGKPAPGFDTKIINPDTGERAAAGDVGELCLRGPYLMQRYHRRSREECFDADGWFHTGDLVRTDPDGYYYFVGRRGSMIKTAGANVSPEEVEAAIARVSGGTPAHVVGIPDPERGQVVAAVIVSDSADFDESGLIRELKSQLSPYKIPKRFARLPSSAIPLLSSGKVDVQRLKEVFGA